MQGLLIRLDDITPDMDWEKFLRLKEIFEKYNIKPLLGIVPENKDPKLHREEARKEFWGIMTSLQKSGWFLSQHGYQHVYVNHEGGILKLNRNSEFAGLSLEEQKRKLSEGKRILLEHGVETDIFMAPSHSYDKVTLKALSETGFHYVTDGYGANPYQYMGLGFIPCTLTHFSVRNGIDTICIHANTMTEQMIGQLEKDICKHRDDFIEWKEVLNGISKRTLKISALEKKELLTRRLKAFVANNKVFQKYMQQTNDKNKYVKLCKRVILLPAVVIKAGIDHSHERT